MKKLLFVLLFLFQISGFSQRYEMEKAFENHNYERVVKLGEQILREETGDYNFFLMLGKSHNALNQFARAIPFLLKANEYAAIEWEYSSAYVEIMEAYFGIGSREKAKRYYNKGIHVRGPKKVQKKFQKLALLFGYDAIYKDWITVKTKNFVFHFEDVRSIEDIDGYIEARINAFIQINSFFNAILPKEIDFFVWKSEGIAQRKFKKFLGFTNPKYCISHNKLTQTLGHEIAHSVSYWYDKKNTRNRFINEGIGVYFDLSYTHRMTAAKEVIAYQRKVNDNFVSYDIRDFWNQPDKHPESILYPIAGAFVEMLINENESKFLKLTREQTYEYAKEVYGKWHLERLISNFNKKLNEYNNN